MIMFPVIRFKLFVLFFHISLNFRMSNDEDFLIINYEEEAKDKDRQIEALKAEIVLLKQSNYRNGIEATNMLLLSTSVPPHTRITENNRIASLLIERIQPEMARVKLKTNVVEIELQMEGILAKWASYSSVVGFTQHQNHYDGSGTLSRPIFSFQNFLKYFDPLTLTSTKGLTALLVKFDRRLDRFREDLQFLRGNTRHVTSADAYINIAAQLYLFHVFSPHPWQYRYPMTAPIYTDYFDEDGYRRTVSSVNKKQLTEEHNISNLNLQEQEQRFRNGIGGKRGRF